MSTTTLVNELICKIEQIYEPICDSYNLQRMANRMSQRHRCWESQFPEGPGDEQCVFGASHCFTICLDVAEFKPSELLVKVAGNCVTIEGKHGERVDEGGFIERDFKRRCFIPQSFDAINVTSTISPEGVLTISAPQHTIETGAERIIGIQVEGSYPGL